MSSPFDLFPTQVDSRLVEGLGGFESLLSADNCGISQDRFQEVYELRHSNNNTTFNKYGDASSGNIETPPDPHSKSGKALKVLDTLDRQFQPSNAIT